MPFPLSGPAPPGSRGSRSRILPLGWLALLMACSGDDSLPDGPVTPPSLEAAFQVVDTFLLEEVPGDSIADIGSVDVLPDGRLLIGDRLLPRVRLYGADGTFVTAQGRFGEGPFEYQGIVSAAMDARGRVFIESVRSPHTTRLTSGFEPDTVLAFPGDAVVSTSVARFGEGILQLAGDFRSGIALWARDAEGEVLWKAPSLPPGVNEKPYWSSVNRPFVAATDRRVVAANRLVYPLTIYDLQGDTVAELGTPPPTFTPAPELAAGALAFTDPAGGPPRNTLAEWLQSFTIINGIHAVAGRWLVVSHATMDPDTPFPPFGTLEYALDVYDLETNAKVLEDVPVPDGGRVLGGGPHLHVLVMQPPGPWTVVRYRIPGG
jgi:hypothetical protein